MNTLASLLFLIINNSLQKDTNYYIAYELLLSCQNIQDLTLSMLAKNAHASITSVNKFCKMLGFKNFAELKFAFIYRNQVRVEQLECHIRYTDEDKILKTISLLSTQTFDVVKFKSSVNHVVDLIHQSPKVLIIGACFPQALSLHFQDDMLMLGKFIYSKTIKQSIDLSDEDERSLIFVISITGRVQSYFKHSFINVCQNFENIVVMSSSLDSVDQHSINEFIQIPLQEDNENGNVMILEILRYIKLKYYQKYYRVGE